MCLANWIRYLRSCAFNEKKYLQPRSGFGEIIALCYWYFFDRVRLGPYRRGVSAGFTPLESSGSVIDPYADGTPKWQACDDQIEIVVAVQVLSRDVELGC